MTFISADMVRRVMSAWDGLDAPKDDESRFEGWEYDPEDGSRAIILTDLLSIEYWPTIYGNAAGFYAFFDDGDRHHRIVAMDDGMVDGDNEPQGLIIKLESSAVLFIPSSEYVEPEGVWVK